MIKVKVQKLYEKPNSLDSITDTLLNKMAESMKGALDKEYQGVACEKCIKDSNVTIIPQRHGKHFTFSTAFCCPEFETSVEENHKVSFEINAK